MKMTASRSLIAIALVAVLVAGFALFLFREVRDGDEWAAFPVNGHVYSDGVLVSGSIADRNGVMLADIADGQRVFADSYSVRKAMLQIVGDREGYIGTGMLNAFSSDLMAYDLVNGVYSSTGLGNRIDITIDSELSAYAAELLGSRSGSVSVYNYKTGEVLCFVSSPSYDPDDVPLIEDGDERYDGVYMNRCISSTFVPGSVFKVVTAAAAIESIPDIYEREFVCEGSIHTDDGDIVCTGVHGTIGFEEALAVSCNCAFAEISQLVGSNKLEACAEKLGMCESFSISEIYTAAGSLDKSTDGSSDLSWAGIGQYKDLVNPAAFMRLMGAIANDGVAHSPYFVSKITNSNGFPSRLIKKSVSNRLMSSKTAQSLKALLANNFSSNYIYSLGAFDGLCAKSGTAETGEDSYPHGWFAGLIDNPETPLAFVVVVENGGWGLSSAAPIAVSVLNRAISLDFPTE